MEKIRLLNDLELNLEAMGIVETEKSRSFTFASEMTYTEIEALFTNVDNISSIKYISEAGETLTTYVDGVALKKLSKDYEAETYTVVLSTDAVEAQIKTLISQIEVLTAAQTAK